MPPAGILCSEAQKQNKDFDGLSSPMRDHPPLLGEIT
jgi:hypothetical protein